MLKLEDDSLSNEPASSELSAQNDASQGIYVLGLDMLESFTTLCGSGAIQTPVCWSPNSFILPKLTTSFLNGEEYLFVIQK
jgi:hypothetical protein